MKLLEIIGIVISTIVFTLVVLYIIGVSVPEDTTTTTTIPTTTTMLTTTTTTTVPLDTDIAWLEQKIHELVNAERQVQGLHNLTWNSEVATVARIHSEDMSINDYFAHTNLQGLNDSDRLKTAGIYYWNVSGENLIKISRVERFYMNSLGDIVNIDYKEWEDFAEECVEGWMNSTGHRANILYPNYNEAGVGAVYNNDTYYYFITQDFITRTDCGYYEGSCCPAEFPYLPWCYVPYECTDEICQ
jgi:uncharacterized protein YkwD